MKGFIQSYFVLCFLSLFSFHFHVDSTAPTRLCPHDQNFALIQFKNSLSVDCSAPDFWCDDYSKKKTISWKEGTNCCLWDGVECESETGNVIGLDLSCCCLRGSIHNNSSLFLLHHLQELNLAYNDFSSFPIAFRFGQFTNLTDLDISRSGFTGTIPLEISHLSKLLFLDLSYNPDLIFEGHVFEKVLENLTLLQYLYLDDVFMSSFVLTSFLNMSSSITTLSLEENGLQGKFPAGVFGFPCLQYFMLSDNDVAINFPMSNWSASLLALEINSVSSIYSSLEEVLDSIGNLHSLDALVLSSCDLKGSIPASFGNLTRLGILDLSYNFIDGPILFSFTNLTKLFRLSLGNNQLSGPLPFSAFNLPQIESLDLSKNKFMGHLPYKVNGLSRLRELRLDFNFISGKIPSWLFSLPSLVELGLSNNKLTDSLNQFHKVAPLRTVDLGNNEIKGPIPSFSKFVNLTFLDLSSNKLNGIFEVDKLSNRTIQGQISKEEKLGKKFRGS